MTAILSFLGSAVFRWALEKLFGLAERKQDHDQELELRREQEKIDAASHARNLELMVKQSELQVQLQEVVHRGAMDVRDADAFTESIRSARPSGNKFIDGWNGSIRPFVATVCVLAWLCMVAAFAPGAIAGMGATEKIALGVLMIEFSLNLVGSVLGWYFGARSLMPGKK
jgi:hypothetical protein